MLTLLYLLTGYMVANIVVGKVLIWLCVKYGDKEIRDSALEIRNLIHADRDRVRTFKCYIFALNYLCWHSIPTVIKNAIRELKK